MYIYCSVAEPEPVEPHYLGPGAGIKFLINIFCRQFGGCYDEEKLISTSIILVILF